jgi:hypothetical protein
MPMLCDLAGQRMPRGSSNGRFKLIAAFAFAILSFSSPSFADGIIQPFETRNTPPMVLDEVRVGAFKQAVDDAPHEGGAALNLEALFGRLNVHYDNKVLDYFVNFRPHVGTTISLDGKTSEFYFGGSWDFKITDWAFFETSFGGAIHDGPLDVPHEASYGCTANFRESASLGFKLSEDWRLISTVDHMSNGGACAPNRGLTNAGVRLGYKF